ncbi:MAG: hypothetical protein WCP06_04645 [Verrucomicrobiota bacterium]
MIRQGTPPGAELTRTFSGYFEAPPKAVEGHRPQGASRIRRREARQRHGVRQSSAALDGAYEAPERSSAAFTFPQRMTRQGTPPGPGLLRKCRNAAFVPNVTQAFQPVRERRRESCTGTGWKAVSHSPPPRSVGAAMWT